MKIRKAVIPVAGFGTRFLPITKSIPKEMLPIIDTPALEYIVKEAVASGITDIVFITNAYKNSIVDYFDKNFELEYLLKESNKEHELLQITNLTNLANVYFVRQKEMLGNANAIYYAKTFIGNEPFAVMYGDDVFVGETPALKSLIDVYNQNQEMVVAALEVKPEVVSRYGVAKYNSDQTLSAIVEKPSIDQAPSNHAIIGRYILIPEIFGYIENLKPSQNNELFLTDAITNMINDGYKVHTSVINHKYYDLGNKIEFIKAIIDESLKRDDTKQQISAYLKEVIK